MRIDKKLNLVVPVGDDGNEIYFHSTPILQETFQKYYKVIAKTLSNFLAEGLMITAPRVAAMELEAVAISLGQWDGKEGIRDGLMAEIVRLTSVIVLTESGWQALPVNVAIQRELVNVEAWEEAKQRIVFFIVICAMAARNVRDDFLIMMGETWQTQTTSLTSTEFANSLLTSNGIETLPNNQIQSSVPV